MLHAICHSGPPVAWGLGGVPGPRNCTENSFGGKLGVGRDGCCGGIPPLPPRPPPSPCKEEKTRFSPSPLLKPSNTPPKVGGLPALEGFEMEKNQGCGLLVESRIKYPPRHPKSSRRILRCQLLEKFRIENFKI